MFRPAILMRNESIDVEPSARIVGAGAAAAGGSRVRGLSTSSSITAGENGDTTENFAPAFLSSRVESRRKYALAVGILDVILGLGQITYHINRAIHFFDYSTHHLGQYEHLSWASYVLWTLTFLVSTLQISMAIYLITASYSKSSLDLSRIRIRRCGIWVMTSQLILTILIIKVTILTASSQLDFSLGVFYVLLEDSTAIWFVLIFYSLQIVFRGFAIYLIKKYIQYLE